MLVVGVLRVGPRTFSRLAEPSHHEANGCEAEECERGAAEVLPVSVAGVAIVFSSAWIVQQITGGGGI